MLFIIIAEVFEYFLHSALEFAALDHDLLVSLALRLLQPVLKAVLSLEDHCHCPLQELLLCKDLGSEVV